MVIKNDANGVQVVTNENNTAMHEIKYEERRNGSNDNCHFWIFIRTIDLGQSNHRHNANLQLQNKN